MYEIVWCSVSKLYTSKKGRQIRDDLLTELLKVTSEEFFKGGAEYIRKFEDVYFSFWLQDNYLVSIGLLEKELVYWIEDFKGETVIDGKLKEVII